MRAIFIGDKNKTLAQWANESKINLEFAKNLLEVIENPAEVPYLLEDIIKDFKKLSKRAKEEIRNALIRVQIGCSINTPSDPIQVGKQLFVSQIIEKLLFRSNLLVGEEEFIEKSKHEHEGLE